jgi:BRCT domain type II-containing protein
MDHTTLEQAVDKFGGAYTKKFSEATSIVLGEKPGSKHVEDINKEGYRTMTEEEFYDRIEAEFAPPAKRAKKE